MSEAPCSSLATPLEAGSTGTLVGAGADNSKVLAEPLKTDCTREQASAVDSKAPALESPVPSTVDQSDEIENGSSAAVKIEKRQFPDAPNLKNQFNESRKRIEKFIGETLDAMTLTEDKDAVREAMKRVLKERTEIRKLAERIVVSEVTPKEMETFAGIKSMLEQNVEKLRYEVHDFVKFISTERGSVASHARSRSSKASSRSSSSRTSNKQQLESSRRDIAALQARLAFAKQEEEMKRKALEQEEEMKRKALEQEEEMRKKALESQLELQQLAIRRELAEKKAIADECQKLETFENPFSQMDDSSGGNSFKEISTSLPKLKPIDKVRDFVAQANSHPDPCPEQQNVNNPLVPPVSSPQAQASSSQSRDLQEKDDYRVTSNANSNRIRPLTRIPDIKVWVFNGDETEYKEWEGSFRSLVEDRVNCVSEKMNLLKQHLGPGPLKVVRSYFLNETEESYQKAISGLKDRYGSSIVVGQSFLKKLKGWRPIREEDSLGLRDFADFLEQVAENKKSVPELGVLDYATSHVYIVKKLPPSIVGMWRSKVCKHKVETGDTSAYPPFEYFVKFVKAHAETRNLPEFRIMGEERYFNSKTTPQKTQYPNKPQVAFGTNLKTAPEGCCHCEKKDHHISVCPDFEKLPFADRKQFINKQYLCFGCGNKCSRIHKGKTCTKRLTCKKCGKSHMTSMHSDPDTVSMCTKVCGSPQQEVDHSMLVPVWIQAGSNASKRIACYAAIDMMSNCSFISEDIKNELGLKGQQTYVGLSTMHGDRSVHTEKILDLKVSSYDEQKSLNIVKAYVKEEIPALRSQIPKASICNKWKHLEKIADKLPPYLAEAKIGILIGSDVPGAVTPREVVAGECNEPFAMRTDLGWGVVGKVCKSTRNSGAAICNRILLQEKKSSASIVLATRAKEVIDPNAIRSMFELDFAEHRGKHVSLSIEDRRFLKIVSEGIQQRPDKHYEMPLPLRDEAVDIPNNKASVLKRTFQLGKRLSKDDKLLKDYVTFMNDILNSYAEEVPKTELELNDGKVNYLIHMGVYHPRKPNQIRVVFDGSAKYMGMSLNDYLLTGPDLLNKMLGVLCRMRKCDYALSADLKSMFFQFFVSPEHRNLLRFFWWENDDVVGGKLKEYRLKVHLFGACSSPSVCNFGLKRAADDGEGEFGTPAADFIRDDFYMDDGLISSDDENELIELAKNSSALCENFGMKLCKFVSNSRKVMESIEPSDRAKDIKEVDLKNDPLPSVRTLGIIWCIENDSLQFRIQLKDTPCTRRGILSSVSSIYDPLGLAAVVLIEPKAILQSLCRTNASWDDPVPTDLLMRWTKWRSEIHLIESVKIDRCYKPPNFGVVKSVELHHFSDASDLAYGQCSYVRLINENDDVSCALVIGKARVAPLNKQVSVARLELTAAVVSARMSRFLKDELKYENAVEYFWVDSMVALGWIKNEARRFHVYVANRVQTIHDYTDVNSWFYVPSALNPSDDASRGISVQQFCEDSRWLVGPDFLREKGAFVPAETPFRPCDEEKAEFEKEMRKATAFASTVVPSSFAFPILDPETLSRFSRWIVCVRSIAVVLNFLEKLRKMPARDVDSSVLKEVECLVVRSAQYECFAREIEDLSKGKPLHGSSSLYRLDPFLDKFSVLRMEGRLENSDEPYEVKHPILIPKKCCITDMLVRYFHERNSHPGRYMTLNSLRQHGYWVVNGSSVVSQVINKCVVCRKMRRPLEVQKMADLPVDRFATEAPFTYAGCDVFGIYHIKEKRSVLKRYCVLFTCMSSRAVHLESLNAMTTDSFINALRRFLARRGPIKQLRCDCGTNFVGASTELKQAVKEMDQSKVKDFLLNEHCDFFEFKFTVPHGSHMSGVIERQIRTVKAALNPILLQFGHILCDESYRTFLAEVENIVNSRPLSVQNLNDPSAPVPLTPQHILTLKSKVLLSPPGVFQKADKYLVKRWRRVQSLVNDFWHKWKREYVSSLLPRQKWNRSTRNLRPGDVVMISESNSPRNVWKLGRIVSVSASDDNLVRTAKVLVGTTDLDSKGKRTSVVTSLDRPIHKLVLLVPCES